MARILLVEDDVRLARVVEEWLLGEQHQVELAFNGPKGLELAKAAKFDVLILDWNLPGMNGIDICKEYRSAGGCVPILLLTGRSGSEDKETGLDSGADDYLTKPFEIRELGARVRAMLRRPPRIMEPD